MNYYIGDFRKDNKEKRGWFLGHFAEEEPKKNDQLEIRYWSFLKGPSGHKKKKQNQSIECALVLKGRAEGEINGDKVELKQGDYFVISPGIESNFPINVFEDIEGLTIKAPSIPNDTIR